MTDTTIRPKYGSRGVVWHGCLRRAPWTPAESTRYEASEYTIEGVDDSVALVLQTAKRGEWSVVVDGEVVAIERTKVDAQRVVESLLAPEIALAEAAYYRISVETLRSHKAGGR